ncbi:enoyl-CoA hydratase/isomerase family protein [Streptomyces sp. TP-A0874]|uniref:enoyl-CoA hydratase/isomerase family protein n=1 Tax=Streptomyces sp. TP-A0874 TaxID=549819 RepID=UPI00099F7038|nr:enoyl-CoA hydratase/isomerase family protein [Streptomyces sp. TP-A0874]
MGDLLVDHDGDVTTLTLNRDAKRNSLSEPLVEGLLHQVREACSNGTGLLVFRGSGKSFSAGFDFSGFDEQGEATLLRRFIRIEQLLQAVAHAPVTTLALVHGPTFGAGADLAVACDHRVFDPSATLRMPGFRFGLALGTRRLAQRTGRDFALAMLQEARTISAAEALRAGVASHVTAREEWESVVLERARHARSLSPTASARLHHCLTPDTRDGDLAELVRSAAAPGLVDRIRAFKEESR